MTFGRLTTGQYASFLGLGLLAVQAAYPGFWASQILLVVVGLGDLTAFGETTRSQIAHSPLHVQFTPFIRFGLLVATIIAFHRRSRLAYAFYAGVIFLHITAWVAALSNPHFTDSFMGYVILVVEAVTILIMFTADRLRRP